MEIVQIVWLCLVVLFIIIEASTAAIVSIWFCLGALVALLVSLIWPSAIAAQVVAFLVVAALTLLALRPLTKKLVGNRRVPTNADANIGKRAEVVDERQPGRAGRVRLEGLEWKAQSDTLLPVGSWCVVQAIEGVTLRVEPEKAPEA